MRFRRRFRLMRDEGVIGSVLEYGWRNLAAQIAIDACVVHEEVAGDVFGVGVLWIRHASSLLLVARVRPGAPLDLVDGQGCPNDRDNNENCDADLKRSRFHHTQNPVPVEKRCYRNDSETKETRDPEGQEELRSPYVQSATGQHKR